MKLQANAQVNNKKQNKKESKMKEQDVLNLIASFYGDAIKAQAQNTKVKAQNKKESNMTKVKEQVKAQNNLSLADAIMQILHNSKACLKASEISKMIKTNYGDANFKTDSKFVSSRLINLLKNNKINVKKDADDVNVYFISKPKIEASKPKILEAYIRKYNVTITLSKEFIDKLMLAIFDNSQYKSTKQAIAEALASKRLLKNKIENIPMKTLANHILAKMGDYGVDYIDKKTEVRYSKINGQPYLVNLYRLTK